MIRLCIVLWLYSVMRLYWEYRLQDARLYSVIRLYRVMGLYMVIRLYWDYRPQDAREIVFSAAQSGSLS